MGFAGQLNRCIESWGDCRHFGQMSGGVRVDAMVIIVEELEQLS